MSQFVGKQLSPSSDESDRKSINNNNNNNNNNKLSLEERFKQLESLLSIGPTLFDGKSINCELLCDVLIAIYNECQRFGLIGLSIDLFIYICSKFINIYIKLCLLCN